MLHDVEHAASRRRASTASARCRPTSRLMTARAPAPTIRLCRNEKCAVSMPPSHDCAQLHCWSFFDDEPVAGRQQRELDSGKAGGAPGGPKYAQTNRPTRAWGSASADPAAQPARHGRIVGMSTQRPSTSNFQPW